MSKTMGPLLGGVKARTAPPVVAGAGLRVPRVGSYQVTLRDPVVE